MNTNNPEPKTSLPFNTPSCIISARTLATAITRNKECHHDANPKHLDPNKIKPFPLNPNNSPVQATPQPHNQLQPSQRKIRPSHSQTPQDEQSNTSKDTQKSQKGAGQAPGSQGYNDNDSRALVRAIKEVLPLGANEWSRVVDMYNDYAQKNQRAFRDEKSIRNKFKGLHSARKPTGDPMIKDFIRDAKAAFEEMRARAARYENVDVDEDEDEEYVMK
ncbi:hypothetical protein Pst134EB_003636 [Puccinia striiformis f. sp. tritici]|nr:hypothetical protein Pst134EB_003636 [Puccinia striiformis f. sp. tritici]